MLYKVMEGGGDEISERHRGFLFKEEFRKTLLILDHEFLHMSCINIIRKN